MMFLDLVSELEKKHDIFDKHCYDNRQVYSLESIADLQQAQQPKSDVVYFTYDLSTLHNRKLPRNLEYLRYNKCVKTLEYQAFQGFLLR